MTAGLTMPKPPHFNGSEKTDFQMEQLQPQRVLVENKKKEIIDDLQKLTGHDTEQLNW